MSQLTRFGRRIALPSTRQIRHELLVMMQDDQRRASMTVRDDNPPSPQPVSEPPAVAL